MSSWVERKRFSRGNQSSCHGAELSAPSRTAPIPPPLQKKKKKKVKLPFTGDLLKKESRVTFSNLVFLPGESQGRGAWWAAVFGVAQSWTRLKWLSSSSGRDVTRVERESFLIFVRATGSAQESGGTALRGWRGWWWRTFMSLWWHCCQEQHQQGLVQKVGNDSATSVGGRLGLDP